MHSCRGPLYLPRGSQQTPQPDWTTTLSKRQAYATSLEGKEEGTAQPNARPSPRQLKSSLQSLDLWETGGFNHFFLLESGLQSFPTKLENSFSWIYQIEIVSIQILHLTFTCLREAHIRGSDIK